MENTKKRTWKSLVAGILDIVIGALNMLGVLGLVIANFIESLNWNDGEYLINGP